MQRLCLFHLLSLILASGKDELIWDKEYITITIEAGGKCDRRFNYKLVYTYTRVRRHFALGNFKDKGK